MVQIQTRYFMALCDVVTEMFVIEQTRLDCVG